MGTLALGALNIQASESTVRTVYTQDGVVQFVPETVSVNALANLLFPGRTPLTRSIFDENKDTPAVPVSVAMLIRFEFDSDLLTNESKGRLDKIGQMMSLGHMAAETLLVEGHTDVIGSEVYNLDLSVRRAKAVKNYLVSEHDIAKIRLQTAGKGETSLIDLSDPKGSINRRVQFSPGA